MSALFSKNSCVIASIPQADAAVWQVGKRGLESSGHLLIYHESAEVQYTVGSVLIHGAVGSVLFLPADTVILAEVLKKGSVISIEFTLMDDDQPLSGPSLIATAVPSHLRNRFQHAAALQAQPPSLSNQYAMLSDFFGILYELERNTPRGHRQNLLEEKIRPSIAYIENHIPDRKLNLKQIASLSGISETHFRSLFTELYGCTPLQYMIELRVRKAECLLQESDLSMAEIRRSCGFQSHAYFTKQFLRIVGKSPNTFREK